MDPQANSITVGFQTLLEYENIQAELNVDMGISPMYTLGGFTPYYGNAPIRKNVTLHVVIKVPWHDQITDIILPDKLEAELLYFIHTECGGSLASKEHNLSHDKAYELRKHFIFYIPDDEEFIKKLDAAGQAKFDKQFIEDLEKEIAD